MPRPRYSVTLLVAGTLVLAALLSACGADDEPQSASAESGPITFATVPVGDDPTAENPIESFAGLLEEETGRDVEVTDVPDYLAVVEAIRAGHVDIGIMSGFPSALAVNTGEVDALVAWPGADEPVSTCVVLADSPIQTLEDLRGTTVAFADPASSSGYFMPVHMLHEAGLTKDEDYDVVFSGSHDASFTALQQGQVDAACSAILLTQPGSDYFPFAEGETRNVGESASMPISLTVLARPSLDDETRTLLKKAVPAVLSEENAEQLGPLAEGVSAAPIIEPDPSEFQTFVDIAAIADVDISDLE